MFKDMYYPVESFYKRKPVINLIFKKIFSSVQNTYRHINNLTFCQILIRIIVVAAETQLKKRKKKTFFCSRQRKLVISFIIQNAFSLRSHERWQNLFDLPVEIESSLIKKLYFFCFPFCSKNFFYDFLANWMKKKVSGVCFEIGNLYVWRLQYRSFKTSWVIKTFRLCCKLCELLFNYTKDLKTV